MAKLFQYRYQRLLARPSGQCLALSTILLTPADNIGRRRTGFRHYRLGFGAGQQPLWEKAV